MAKAPIIDKTTRTIEGILNCEDGIIECVDLGELELIKLLEKFDGENVVITINLKK